MKTNVFILAAVAALMSSAAVAQTTTFTNRGAADDAIDDLEEAIIDDERDIGRIGNDGREVGQFGSVALRGTSTSNDGATSNDLGIGLRWGTFDGVNGFDVSASFSYGDEDGVETENSLLVGLDYRRDFNPSIFAFGQIDASFDRLTVDAAEFKQDVFVGVGLGYRIFNDSRNQWSIQAGPGYRVGQLGDGSEIDEAAASISSNFFYTMTDTTFVTNDTDVIYSETATTVTNTLALNVSLTDTLTLRTSYATNFNDQSDDTFTDAENTFGIAAVYNFN